MYFVFDNIESSDMDLYIMRLESGFVTTPYIGGATIHEERSKNRITPYFYGVERNPIEFTVKMFLVDENLQPKKWDSQTRFNIAKWLVHDTYKEFQTSDDLGKKYYAILVNEIDLNLINTQGYFEATFRTNSPFAWSSVFFSEFNLSENLTSMIIELENKSNVVKYYNPLIEIQLVNGATGFQLKNLSNNGLIMKFEGLTANETVSIDCQNKIIKSNLFGSNPFSKFNVGMKRYWMDLVYGINQIEVIGTCIVKVKSQYPIAQ